MDLERLHLLPEIATQYAALRADAENTMDVTIVSAVPLSAEQEAKLTEALNKRIGRAVRIQCRIEPEILGGAIVQAGDFMIDGSLKGAGP